MSIGSTTPRISSRYDQRADLLRQAVDEYHVGLVRYAYSYTRHWQDAENIVQELWKYAIVYLPEDKMLEFPLLRRKTYQLFIDHYRQSKRKPAILTDELPEKR